MLRGDRAGIVPDRGGVQRQDLRRAGRVLLADDGERRRARDRDRRELQPRVEGRARHFRGPRLDLRRHPDLRRAGRPDRGRLPDQEIQGGQEAAGWRVLRAAAGCRADVPYRDLGLRGFFSAFFK